MTGGKLIFYREGGTWSRVRQSDKPIQAVIDGEIQAGEVALGGDLIVDVSAGQHEVKVRYNTGVGGANYESAPIVLLVNKEDMTRIRIAPTEGPALFRLLNHGRFVKLVVED